MVVFENNSEKNFRPLIKNYKINAADEKISEIQRLAHIRVKKHLLYDDSEIKSLILDKNGIYLVRDKIAMLRYVVLSMDVSKEILNCLKIMYPKLDSNLILPKMLLSGKFVKNTIKIRQPDIKLVPGQIVKIYTKVGGFWGVRPRILIKSES